MKLKAKDRDELLRILQTRFETHPQRHAHLEWDEVRARLEAHPTVLWSLQQMEATGGEPDVIALDPVTGRFVFCDCSPESPSGRRSLCFDAAARTKRKEHAPETSALELATAMGVELLTEDQYRQLQQLGEFDVKTSSWIATPAEVRELGGALFCDRRYGKVFVYHNGAQSYYAVRGFRGCIQV